LELSNFHPEVIGTVPDSEKLLPVGSCTTITSRPASKSTDAFVVPFGCPSDLDIERIRPTSLILYRHGFSMESGNVGVDLYKEMPRPNLCEGRHAPSREN
jgi:hypothetical protein